MEHLSELDITAIRISVQLAVVTSVCLILVCSPLAWWLSRANPMVRTACMALASLPLVLPPTVLGFYLLQAFGPESLLGEFWFKVTQLPLVFSFSGLVFASMLYSLPFALIPLIQGFQSISTQMLHQSSMLGATPKQTFNTLVVVSCRQSYIFAIMLCFAHTLGEFGVALMVGGNIPGSTQLISIRIYEQVETLNLPAAHQLSLLMCLISLMVVGILFAIQPKKSLSPLG